MITRGLTNNLKKRIFPQSIVNHHHIFASFHICFLKPGLTRGPAYCFHHLSAHLLEGGGNGCIYPHRWVPVSKGHPSSSQSSNAKYNPCLPKARWWRKRSKETISLKGCLFCCFFFLTPPLNHLKAECTRIILLRPETKAWVSQTSLYLKKKEKETNQKL